MDSPARDGGVRPDDRGDGGGARESLDMTTAPGRIGAQRTTTGGWEMETTRSTRERLIDLLDEARSRLDLPSGDFADAILALFPDQAGPWSERLTLILWLRAYSDASSRINPGDARACRIVANILADMPQEPRRG